MIPRKRWRRYEEFLCSLVHLAILLLEDLLGLCISEIAWGATNPDLAASKERVDLLETESCGLGKVDVEEDSNNSIGDRPWNAMQSCSLVTRCARTLRDSLVVATNALYGDRRHHDDGKVHKVLHADAERVGTGADGQGRYLSTVNPARYEPEAREACNEEEQADSSNIGCLLLENTTSLLRKTASQQHHRNTVEDASNNHGADSAYIVDHIEASKDCEHEPNNTKVLFAILSHHG